VDPAWGKGDKRKIWVFVLGEDQKGEGEGKKEVLAGRVRGEDRVCEELVETIGVQKLRPSRKRN